MEGAQNCTCVTMMREQYQEYDEDYCEDKTLKWFCHSCQDQEKGITQNETPIAWGKIKDIKEIRKSQFGI